VPAQSNLDFVYAACPHSWLLVADDLHHQAITVYKRRGQSYLGHYDYRKGTPRQVDTTNRTAFLLGGFALENAIKAFLVYEKPTWISNGALARPLRSHHLLDLKSKSTLIPYRSKYDATIAAFESGLDSWARYPCNLSAEKTNDEPILTDRQWQAYLVIMRAYGRRLHQLLEKPWVGPHGFTAQYGFRDFMSLASSLTL